MKISKLFHWLYAIVMLLPVFIFIPNAFYYGFNETAVAQTRTEQVPVYYSTNSVESYSDFVNGNAYLWNDNYTTTGQSWTSLMKIYANNKLNTLTNNPNATYYDINVNGSNGIYLAPNIGNSYRVGSISFSFVFMQINNQTSTYWDEIITHFSRCDNMVKEYQPVEYSMSITDSMSTAWNQVWTNDIFSWSYNSFLSEPFKYIGNVFGLPIDNPIYYCLSYWLDISIIWLVFDLIMYIPLLVHRWIDKGIIE